MTSTGKVILESLTPREREVLSLICSGLTDGQISTVLGVGTQVVKNYSANIRLKTRRRNRIDLAIYAFYHGIVECPCKGAAQNHK